MNRSVRIGLMSVACTVLLVALFKVFADPVAPPAVVGKVDLNRYMGKWREIAAIPMYFQRKCVANTMAEYTLLESGQVNVLNSCETASGNRIRANGRAKVVDPQTSAKLKVTFVNLLGWRFIAGGDYWVIALDEKDYGYAVIGHPKRKYAWILSRTPELSVNTLKTLAGVLRQQGYDPCDLIVTPQSGGLQKKQPLCQVVSP